MALIEKIKAELAGNTALYSTMTDQQVADELNRTTGADRLLPRSGMSGDELFGYTDSTEYKALTPAQQNQWLLFCALPNIERKVLRLVKTIFPATTATWLAIKATHRQSRAQVLNLPTIEVGFITRARA